MSGRSVDFPERIWSVISDEIAVGYEKDLLGDFVMIGLVVFEPTSEKLRSLPLRALARVEQVSNPIKQHDPPSVQQLAEVWAASPSRKAAVRPPTQEGALPAKRSLGITQQQMLEAATRPDLLIRQDGESPEDFYGRVASVHAALSHVSKRPTFEIARMAKVPVGTAAAWVSRARARGMYLEEPEEVEDREDE